MSNWDNGVIIQASSRSFGNSNKIIQEFNSYHQFPVLDLATKSILPYNYSHESKDDFLEVMEYLVSFDTWVIVTPVYWYSMSGLMKNFLDRITDCLKIRKDLGYQLKGMKMYVISCGSECQPVEGFFIPFLLSAEYLGMKYLGDLHTWVDGDALSDDVVGLVKGIASYKLKKKVLE